MSNFRLKMSVFKTISFLMRFTFTRTSQLICVVSRCSFEVYWWPLWWHLTHEWFWNQFFYNWFHYSTPMVPRIITLGVHMVFCATFKIIVYPLRSYLTGEWFGGKCIYFWNISIAPQLWCLDSSDLNLLCCVTFRELIHLCGGTSWMSDCCDKSAFLEIFR